MTAIIRRGDLPNFDFVGFGGLNWTASIQEMYASVYTCPLYGTGLDVGRVEAQRCDKENDTLYEKGQAGAKVDTCPADSKERQVKLARKPRRPTGACGACTSPAPRMATPNRTDLEQYVVKNERLPRQNKVFAYHPADAVLAAYRNCITPRPPTPRRESNAVTQQSTR